MFDVNHRGQTPLMVAVAQGNDALAANLIAMGCPVKAKDPQGLTALHYAAGRKAYPCDIIRALVDAGADIDAPDTAGSTPLHHAVNWVNLSSTACLTGLGADTDARDNLGDTPLQVAERLKRGPDFVRALAVPAPRPRVPWTEPLTAEELTQVRSVLANAFNKLSAADAGADVDPAAAVLAARTLLSVDAQLSAAVNKPKI